MFDVEYYSDSFKDDLFKVEQYSVNIVNVNTSYQFDEKFYLRCTLRYNDFDDKLLTDILLSYTFSPGTAIYLGYGGLYENKVWKQDSHLNLSDSLIQTKKIIYFKVSYLWGKK